jgi:hypothetical protein
MEMETDAPESFPGRARLPPQCSGSVRWSISPYSLQGDRRITKSSAYSVALVRIITLSALNHLCEESVSSFQCDEQTTGMMNCETDCFATQLYVP